MKSFKQFIKEEVEQIDEISKKLAKSYLDKSAAEREANPQYPTREKFRSRMIGGATAGAKLKGRVQEPYKFGQAPKRKMYVKVKATNEEVDLDEAYFVTKGNVQTHDKPFKTSDEAIHHANKEEDRTSRTHTVHHIVGGKIKKQWQYSDSQGKFASYNDHKDEEPHFTKEEVETKS